MGTQRAMWVIVVSTWATVAAADPCAKPSDVDASPATAIAIGDCYARQGDNASAAHWYRDAAQRSLAVPAESPAPPDHREAWRVTMWTSLAVTAIGIGMYAVGRAEMNDATSQLCAGGAYPANPSCGHPTTLSVSQVESLNEQGERGQTYSRVGLAAGILGAGAAAVSAYEAYLGHHESRFAIAPAIGPGAAGAQLGLRW